MVETDMTLINLRQARKTRERAEKRAHGDANAAKFGRSKTEKQHIKAEAERAARQHEGHRREGGDD